MSPVHLPPDTDDQRLARIAHAAVLGDEAEWLSGHLDRTGPDTLGQTIAAIAGAALAVLLVISAAVLWGT